MLITKILGVLGVAVGLAIANQSESTEIDDQPMGPQEVAAQKRRIETPEVVLQLKYDRGELNRIYLAQFRKGMNGWAPSVSARSDLCTDLCHAGLGGNVCSPTCEELIPVGLRSALHNGTHPGETFGEPRVEVCPTLCHNHLGVPLCNCPVQMQEDGVPDVNWQEVCNAFCIHNYVLRGCPACNPNAMQPAYSSMRVLNTADGWVAWCNAQCRQGHGGAACNCDRVPL